MLYVSLVLSAVVLVVAYRAARPAPHPVRWDEFVVTGAVVTASPCFLLMASPPTTLLVGGLAAALLAWPLARRRVRSFLPLAAGAFVAAYGVATWSAVGRLAELDRVREQYPYEAMADRVPAPPPGPPLPTLAARRLDELDDRLERDDAGAMGDSRARRLRQLHEDTVRYFVNS